MFRLRGAGSSSIFAGGVFAASHCGCLEAGLAEREELTLTFMPWGAKIAARRGDTILDAALDNGIDLPHECGGNCACTTCHIRILSGAGCLSPIADVEEDRLASAEGLTPTSRLGCQAILLGGSVEVEIVGCQTLRSVLMNELMNESADADGDSRREKQGGDDAH